MYSPDRPTSMAEVGSEKGQAAASQRQRTSSRGYTPVSVCPDPYLYLLYPDNDCFLRSETRQTVWWDEDVTIFLAITI
jgi:hypothetical protein